MDEKYDIEETINALYEKVKCIHPNGVTILDCNFVLLLDVRKLLQEQNVLLKSLYEKLDKEILVTVPELKKRNLFQKIFN